MNSWDHIKCLTKDEIIQFLKKEIFLHAPSKRDVCFFQYDTTARKLIDEMDNYINTDSVKKSALAKKIDELAHEYNASTNFDTKLNILNKREKLYKKLSELHEKWNLIMKKQDLNDKRWEKLENSFDK